MTLITSVQNPKVKFIVGLRERRDRVKAGLFLVEGYDELSVALASDLRPIELYYCPAMFRERSQARLVNRVRDIGAQVIEVDERVFKKIAYRDNPDGWLATFPAPRRGLTDLRLSANPFLVVAQTVEKPGNLGAMLRTADAANVDAVISCDPLTDWGNPNVIRASKGALFTVQVAEAKSSDTITWLRQHNIKIVVATPQATLAHTQADFRGPVAIAVGTEKQGLTSEWLDQADEAVIIPMFGRVNSLNVSTSTAILIYEVIRQRSGK